jgi:hypothetical protein
MSHIIKSIKLILVLAFIFLTTNVPPGYSYEFTYIGVSSGWTAPFSWQYQDEDGNYHLDKYPQGPNNTAIIPGYPGEMRTVNVDINMSVGSLTINQLSSLTGGGHHFVSADISNYGSISAINGIFELGTDKIYNQTSESGLITGGSGKILRLFSCEVSGGIVDPKGGAVEFFDSSLTGVTFRGSTSRILVGSPAGTKLLGSNTIEANALLEVGGLLFLAGNQSILTNQGNITLKSNDNAELHGVGVLTSTAPAAALDGSGILTMEKYTAIEVKSGKLTNGPRHTIKGNGTIRGNLDNQGKIEAAGDMLEIQNANITNIGQGILTASTPGANLRLNGSSLSGGALLPGEGAVELHNATIKDVHLGAGDIHINQSATFVNSIFTDQRTSIDLGSGSRLDLTEDNGSKKSLITNDGVIKVHGGPFSAIMAAVGTEVTLAGHGMVSLGGEQSLMTAQLGGSFINAAAHTISGAGTIGAPLVNLGTITTESGNLFVLGEFPQNNGSIKLRGGAFDTKGQQLTNLGWIEGYGALKTGGLINENVLFQQDGNLWVPGDVINNGKIALHSYPTYFGNDLQGPKVKITNNGQFTTSDSDLKVNGNLTNTKNIVVTRGSLEMVGTLLNETSGKITLDSPKSASVTGDVTNNGEITINNCNFKLSNSPEGNLFLFINNGKMTVSQSTIEHLGTFQNNNAYISDPSTNNFGTVIVSQNGYIQGGQGDRFVVQGNFINESSQNLSWNTTAALLKFAGGGNHIFRVASKDLGPSGFTDNFAWGTLELEAGNTLTLEGDVHFALYVGELLGLTFGSPIITNIFGHGLNIYYDPSLPGNEYLNGQTFMLTDGGALAPGVVVPLPTSAWLFLSGLAGIGLVGKGRRIIKS